MTNEKVKVFDRKEKSLTIEKAKVFKRAVKS